MWKLRQDQRGLREASFAQPLFLVRLRMLPLLVAYLNSFGLFAIWPGMDELDRFGIRNQRGAGKRPAGPSNSPSSRYKAIDPGEASIHSRKRKPK